MQRRGFTLIEIVIVLFLIALLAVFALGRFLNLRSQAQQSQEAGVIAAVRAGINHYYGESIAQRRSPVFPPALDAAPTGPPTPVAPLFSAVLASGVTGEWQKSAMSQYRGPTGVTYAYDSATGKFEALSPVNSSLIFSSDTGVNDGNIVNALRVSGLSGKAFSFNGTNATILLNNASALNPTAEITMEAWAYASAQKTAKVMEKGDWDGSGIDQNLWNGWQVGVATADGLKHTIHWMQGQPTLNQWYHIAMTYDGAQLKLYVNGTLSNSMALTGAIRVNGRPLSVGSDQGNQKFFNGMIDSANIYSQALTSEQIQAQYNALKP